MTDDRPHHSEPRYERVDLRGATFRMVDLTGARFEQSDLHRVTMRGVEIADTTIDGDISNLVINGVSVAPLIEAELDRRDPDRALFRPTTPAGFREAWAVNERRWAATIDRARALPDELLQVSVDGEWSFIQTLRHLAFASESWVARCVLAQPRPWHPLSLPWDTAEPIAGVPYDTDSRPSLAEAMSVRQAAMTLVGKVIEELTDDELDRHTQPCVGPGWPPEGASYPVRKCLSIVLNEEWAHRVFAERDLAALEAQHHPGAGSPKR